MLFFLTLTYGATNAVPKKVPKVLELVYLCKITHYNLIRIFFVFYFH